MSLDFNYREVPSDTIPFTVLSLDEEVGSPDGLVPRAWLTLDRSTPSPETQAVNHDLAVKIVRAVLKMPPKWQTFLRVFLEGEGIATAEREAGLCKNWWVAGGREVLVKFLKREMRL